MPGSGSGKTSDAQVHEANVERLLAPFHAAAGERLRQADPAWPVELIGVKVQVVADPDCPVGGDKWR